MPTYGFNGEMERAVVRQILADPLVLPRIARHLRPEGFEDPMVKVIVGAALLYFKAANAAPTAVAVLQEIREQVNRGKAKPGFVQEVASAIEDARTRPGVSSDYVVDKVLRAERDLALWGALERSTKLYVAGKRDEIVTEIERAASIGRVDSTMGQDHVGTLAARTEYRLKYKAPIRWGTGIVELDDLTDGGLSLDNPLGCFLAPPKGGKSQALDQCALFHQEMGGFAFYGSLENGEREVLDRHDASIAMVPIKHLHARADEVEAKVRAFCERTKGGMHVKKFPGGRQTCCRDVDAYLVELRASQSVTPTLIVLDYWDELAANDPDKYEKRHEELEAIGQEMRALAEKWKCVCWTASRVTKAALEKKGIDVGDVAGAFAKANVVDLMVAIIRSAEDKAGEKVRFAVVASRFSGDAAPTGPLPSALACGRIVVQHAIQEASE
jgi:replicative DNA helicase